MIVTGAAENGCMSIIQQGRNAIKNILFGDSLLPAEFTIGVMEPQTEVAVWLHGMGTPLDVTRRCTTACCSPLMIGISVDEGQRPCGKNHGKVSLTFCEKEGQKRLLGEIRLAFTRAIPLDSSELVLFTVLGSTNYCLPRMRLWAHYFLQAYSYYRKASTFDVKMTLVEQRAAMVTFIRPHPLVLVTLTSEAGGNIFPMNIMGDLGHCYFAFALKKSRLAGQLVQRAGRLALSSVPVSQSSIAYRLAINHTKDSIDWNQLPFAVKTSSAFHIPVPMFALRVREMEVEKVLELGSHTLFVARIVSDESYAEDLQVNVIHGFYQSWRLRGHSAELKESVVKDTLNKRGLSPAQTVR
jgi:flavin reductase (DIM6/NTAB) family NADH-FMN oxidoreductase RutF